jgi:hypothetical protein
MDVKRGRSVRLREVSRLREYENRVLRRIFGPKREEAAEGRTQFYSEELHNFYSSSNITMAIKSQKMRYVGHVACTGDDKWIQYFA